MSINAGSRRDAPQFEILDPVMASALRAKSPAERLAIGHAMWRSARDMLRNLMRAEHPDWSDDEVNLAAARRLQHEH